MSFLVGEVDTISTLEELVTFIDAWDVDNSNSVGDVTSSESENDSSPYSKDVVESVLLDSLNDVLEGASFLPEKKPETQKPTKRKRTKSPGASTRLQRRKRAEILALRAQSHQLQGHLEQLQRIRTGPATSANIPPQRGVVPASWSTIAATEYQERLKSEMTNQKLRAIMLEQMKVNKALLFQTQVSLGNLDSVFGSQPSPAAGYPSTEPGYSSIMIEGLVKMVEGLYLDSEAVFQHNEALPAGNDILRVKQERRRGRVIEITTTTVLPCSVQEASAMFWREYLTARQYKDKSYRFLRQRKPASVERVFVWRLESDAGVAELNGFTFVRKIEEPNRVVLVAADRLLLATGGLQFRLQRWIIITRSDDELRPGSVARVLLQLHAEYSNDFTGKKDDPEDLVMGALCQRLQAYFQWQHGECVLEAQRMRMSTEL
ncbi:hypothetical protein PF005_g20274 [Phytophthora fragariae]|uniref:Uncharacterized protein n=1 Tax=Phytophthora fragariae TaxID=53985 RepID=A0A6A3WR83_9STRA|nr:hypothetical protein PF003_g36908 [Phytophthora fragariae]KAE8928871.1 hypothetical protein PF009_g20997 [Phytophthora fragariae]KAE8982891.1 hypothetical protein PF011_g21425 [Phytophthora fragariae]KAE9081055.1 hypothetical protein PF007_g22806 [Phytophthora fragariae]KAE9104191.1 hypothetical protein PF006_g21976 [Phytophthora fragariae]